MVAQMDAGNVGGSMYSLDNIEHDTLRPSYRDARIHAAVNCASVSCPDMCAPFHRTRLLLSPPRL